MTEAGKTPARDHTLDVALHHLEAGDALTDDDRAALVHALRCAAAVPKPMPGQRSAATVAAMARHHAELRAMASRFYPGLSASAAATAIHNRLNLYRGGADWRRDRSAEGVAYADTVRGACWRALRAYDRVLSPRRIRAVLAMSSDDFMADDSHDVQSRLSP